MNHLALLISPGKGTSGVYPSATLQQAASDRIFPAGTQMYWTNFRHESGDGDLTRLAAVLSEDARYEPQGPAGPGLYATIEVFPDYEQHVAAKGPHIGLSIVAEGDVENGVVKAITRGERVDFVPRAGRGGRVILEAARPNEQTLLAETAYLVQESANLGDYLESRFHLNMTAMADDIYGDGYLNRDERKTLSGALGAGMDAYHQFLVSNAPQLYERGRWDNAPDVPVTTIEAQHEETSDMSDSRLEEVERRLADVQAENARLHRQALIYEAERTIHRLWQDDAYQRVPQAMRDLFAGNALTNLPLTEAGGLDATVLVEGVRRQAQTYLDTLPTPAPGGVAGNGGQPLEGHDDEAAIKRYMARYGLSEVDARRVVVG